LIDPEGFQGTRINAIPAGTFEAIDPNEVADFFSEVSREATLAAVLSTAGNEVDAAFIFGSVAAVASGLEQAFRPDLGQVIESTGIELVTDTLPPQVGGPVGIIINEFRNFQQSQSMAPFIISSDFGNNPNISFGCGFICK